MAGSARATQIVFLMVNICHHRALLASTFLLAPSLAPAQSDQWAAPRAAIKQFMADSGLVSASVAVARHGQIVWEEAFGYADREKKVRATANTMYSLASISKPFTASGLMILVERGKVDLDRPANDYLGAGKLTGLAGDATGATVRRVLSHTAGLPLHYQFIYANEPYQRSPNDEAISRYGILVYPPGERFEYSNLGYGIIDEIVSRVSGMSYPEFMRDNVFLPLGLTHTRVVIAPPTEPDLVQRYDRQGHLLPFYDFDHRGASAIYSSAHDLVRFGMYNLGDHVPGQRAILQQATLDMMHRPVAPADYGLGWIIDSLPGLRQISHTGGMPGVQTALSLFPDEDVAIVVLVNMYCDITPIYLAVEQAILPRYADATRRQAADNAVKAAAAAKRTTPASTMVGEWAGTVRAWQSTIPMSFVVGANGAIRAHVADEADSPGTEVQWSDSSVVARIAGTMPTSDAKRWPHSILLQLRLRNGKLTGMATAQTTADPVHFALTSYVALDKVK
jgi:CubicO group peptidase (beta-lactamase class C family)